MEDERHKLIHDLFQQEASNLYAYVTQSCPAGVDPQDVVQEVFIKAYRFWHTFQGHSSPKTWLFSIARNHIHDTQRRTRREKELITKIKLNSRNGYNLSSSVALQEIIASLPRNEREIIFLRIIQGFSTEETAQILHISNSYVRVSLHRARKHIARLWSDEVIHEGGVKYGR